MKSSAFLTLVVLLTACRSGQQPDIESLKQEVIAAEKAFAAMADSVGVAAAFEHFAADDVVMHRGKKLIKGKAQLNDYFAAQTLKDVKLSWEPSFVDIAESGDLAYTYGPYTFSAKDTSGTMITDTGYFHTVWKRQLDAQWKFVWD